MEAAEAERKRTGLATAGLTVTTSGPVGAIITETDGGVAVASLHHGGASQVAGVKVGMRLISFNGVNVAFTEKAAVIAMIKAAEGRKSFIFASPDTPALAKAIQEAEEAQRQRDEARSRREDEEKEASVPSTTYV